MVTTHARRIRRPAALLAIDLDRLMRLNDQRGLLVGDQVIRGVASRLAALVRWPELVARIGGEEFLVILPETTLDHAIERADAILQTMRSPLDVDGEHVVMTVSIGIAMANADEDLADAYQRADEHLIEAKRRGRDRAVVAI